MPTMPRAKSTRQTFNDGSSIDLAYDAHGNLHTVTEPGNVVTTYDYDPGDHLIKVNLPRGALPRFHVRRGRPPEPR